MGVTEEVCLAAGFRLDSVQVRGLDRYLESLERWSRRHNLVGFRDKRSILENLVLDSFFLARFLETLPLPDDPLVLDLGAGAGIPGVPLRIVWGKGRCFLVEIRSKRVVFLRFVLGSYAEGEGPVRTEVLEERAESVLARLGPVDLVLSRAFMPWPELLGLVKEGLEAKGWVVIMASAPPPAPDEVPSGFAAARSMRYEVLGKARYFWGFTPVGMPR